MTFTTYTVGNIGSEMKSIGDRKVIEYFDAPMNNVMPSTIIVKVGNQLWDVVMVQKMKYICMDAS
jgi:hypothetical protein